MKGEKSMKRIIEIEKEELPVFKKVVSKLSEDSKTVITLKQVIERPEEYDFIDIKFLFFSIFKIEIHFCNYFVCIFPYNIYSFLQVHNILLFQVPCSK